MKDIPWCERHDVWHIHPCADFEAAIRASSSSTPDGLTVRLLAFDALAAALESLGPVERLIRDPNGAALVRDVADRYRALIEGITGSTSTTSTTPRGDRP